MPFGVSSNVTFLSPLLGGHWWQPLKGHKTLPGNKSLPEIRVKQEKITVLSKDGPFLFTKAREIRWRRGSKCEILGYDMDMILPGTIYVLHYLDKYISPWTHLLFASSFEQWVNGQTSTRSIIEYFCTIYHITNQYYQLYIHTNMHPRNLTWIPLDNSLCDLFLTLSISWAESIFVQSEYTTFFLTQNKYHSGETIWKNINYTAWK